MVRGVTLFWLSASHASRGMASGTWPKPGRGARWVILAIHTCLGHLLRLKRATRRPQGQRTHSNATNLTSAGDCMPTTPGYYATTGSTEQTPCPPGTQQPESRKGQCIDCEAGKFTNASSAVICHPCRPGAFCPVGASAPLPCEGGSYGSATGLVLQGSIVCSAHTAATGRSVRSCRVSERRARRRKGRSVARSDPNICFAVRQSPQKRCR